MVVSTATARIRTTTIPLNPAMPPDSDLKTMVVVIVRPQGRLTRADRALTTTKRTLQANIPLSAPTIARALTPGLPMITLGTIDPQLLLLRQMLTQMSLRMADGSPIQHILETRLVPPDLLEVTMGQTQPIAAAPAAGVIIPGTVTQATVDDQHTGKKYLIRNLSLESGFRVMTCVRKSKLDVKPPGMRQAVVVGQVAKNLLLTTKRALLLTEVNSNPLRVRYHPIPPTACFTCPTTLLPRRRVKLARGCASMNPRG